NVRRAGRPLQFRNAPNFSLFWANHQLGDSQRHDLVLLAPMGVEQLQHSPSVSLRHLVRNRSNLGTLSRGRAMIQKLTLALLVLLAADFAFGAADGSWL